MVKRGAAAERREPPIRVDRSQLAAYVAVEFEHRCVQAPSPGLCIEDRWRIQSTRGGIPQCRTNPLLRVWQAVSGHNLNVRSNGTPLGRIRTGRPAGGHGARATASVFGVCGRMIAHRLRNA
jgi:hypothetical protein